MTELLYSLTDLANAVTILVALSTFATVLTVAAPLLQGDRMRSRMKGVINQRPAAGGSGRQDRGAAA
jgi:predicted lysophospholipase L1 biosynthesis ABC-type transport system permease subunit